MQTQNSQFSRYNLQGNDMCDSYTKIFTIALLVANGLVQQPVPIHSQMSKSLGYIHQRESYMAAEPEG